MNLATASANAFREACLVAVPEVLELMFFEPLIDGPGNETPSGLESLDVSQVDFEGTARGHLIIASSSIMTASLAGTFLAIEGQLLSPTNVGLVLGELANVVCGNALGRYMPEGLFRHSTPLTQLGRPREEVPELASHWLRFPLNGGPLFVGLSLEAAG